MVGVPGKSKGCSTCRKRKKGCDQKRPICGQCSASGYICGGYQRDLTFVLHPASKTVEKAVFLPNKARPSLLTTTPSLERTAIVTQCQSLFFDVYLPHGRCMVTDSFILNCGRPANWTNVMQSFTPNEASLELAFAAFSISRVGRNKDDPRLIKESTKFYGKALKNLQKALYDPSRMRSEQVLTACLLLGLYETYEGAGGKSVGWVSHAQGAARIVELRGPERHTEFPAHVLFIGTRLTIIYSAILRRKKTFLSDEDWLTVPWRREPKTGLDRLIDIASHVPGLLEQFDAIRAQVPSTSQLQALQSCLQVCRHLQKSLRTWTIIRRPNSEPIAIDYEVAGPRDPYPFTQVLTYENHLFLNGNLILWLVALIISSTVSEIEFLLASFGFQSTSMLSSTASAMKEAQQCANNIAQSIPYCLLPDMGDLGIGYIQFPMGLAFQFFMKSNNSKVCSWMLEKAKEMQKTTSTTCSPTEGSPISYAAESVGQTIFAPHGFGPQTKARPACSTPTISSDQVSITLRGASSITTNALDSSQRVSSIQNTNLNSDSIDSGPTTTDPDFDADYDIDSDNEVRSSPSNDSGPPTISSSRHGSGSGPSGSKAEVVDPSLVGIDGFTFVYENPAEHYIDRSETGILANP